MKNTTKLTQTKEFKKKGSVGHINDDIGFWHDRTKTELQPMNIGYYIPLAHCADYKLVECMGSTAQKLGDARVFESEFGTVVIRFLWSHSGNKVHVTNTFWYLVYVMFVNIFVMTKSAESASGSDESMERYQKILFRSSMLTGWVLLASMAFVDYFSDGLID